MRGLILFAHGARDPRWLEPFVRLQQRVIGELPETRVMLAFLEFMKPDLESAAAQLVGAGCESLLIVPVFLGQGGHVRRDLPLQVDRLRQLFPNVAMAISEAAGEDAAVIDALAHFAAARYREN